MQQLEHVTSNGNYGASKTFTGTASTGEFEGTGATFDVVQMVVVVLMQLQLLSGGTGFEVNEIIKIAGNLIGGTNQQMTLRFPVATIANTSIPAFSRLDI